MPEPAAGVFPDPKPEPGKERNAWYCPACGTRLSYGVYCKTCKTERSFAYRPHAPGQEDAWLEELEALVKMTAMTLPAMRCCSIGVHCLCANDCACTCLGCRCWRPPSQEAGR